MQPLFVLSLPRSGSTLLQRILAAHSRIATANEPHFLLPLLYAARDGGVFSEYGHSIAAAATQDFIAGLPRGVDDYRAAVRAFARELYASSAGTSVAYFVDKTPKYALVAHELVAAFPDARFVILWRNPLACVASLVETFGHGSWNVDRFSIELHVGVSRLLEVAMARPQNVQIHTLRYEELVAQPESALKGISRFLELDYEPALLTGFGNVKLTGRISDPKSHLSTHAVLRAGDAHAWKRTFASPLRRAWGRRYVRWLGAERLAAMGYDLSELLRELDSIGTDRRVLARDLVEMPLRKASDRLEGYLLRQRFDAWRRGQSWYALR